MSEDFWQDRKVIVTGSRGFLGKHLCERLAGMGVIVYAATSSQLDLRLRDDARRLFDIQQGKKPSVLFHLAARVSGIGAIGDFPATSLHDNLIMGMNVLQAAADTRFDGKIVLVGSVCAYPKYCPQPMIEENLWAGYPEETNGPYGVAKRTLSLAAGVYAKQYGMQVVYPLMANLYGPGDNFDPKTSHVIPALIRKMLEARVNDYLEVSVWGTGNASRDFLYVYDAVDALLLMAEKAKTPEPINIGTGQETIIAWLAETIKKIVGYKGKLVFDASKPDGQPRRCLKTRLADKLLGWKAKTKLEDGLKATIDWYKPIFMGERDAVLAKDSAERDELKRMGFRV